MPAKALSKDIDADDSFTLIQHVAMLDTHLRDHDGGPSTITPPVPAG